MVTKNHDPTGTHLGYDGAHEHGEHGSGKLEEGGDIRCHDGWDIC